MAKTTYNYKKKIKEDRPIVAKRPDAYEIYALLKKKFRIEIDSDGYMEYDEADLTPFEITQLENYLATL